MITKTTRITVHNVTFYYQGFLEPEGWRYNLYGPDGYFIGEYESVDAAKAAAERQRRIYG